MNNLTTQIELEELARRIAAERNIDPALFSSLIEAESGWNPLAESSKGAQGITQMMPLIQKAYGVDDPFDPEQNMRGSAAFLEHLSNKYNNDPVKILGAYHSGEPAIDKYDGLPPADGNPDTHNYVESIVGSGLPKHQDNYEYSSSSEPSVDYGEYIDRYINSQNFGSYQEHEIPDGYSRLVLPDGSVTSAASNISKEEALKLAREQYPESFTVYDNLESTGVDSGPWDAFLASFNRASDSIFPALGVAYADFIGDEELYDHYQGQIIEASDAARKIAPGLLSLDDISKSYEEDGLFSAAAKFVELGVETIGSSLGYQAPSVGAGAATWLVGGAAAAAFGFPISAAALTAAAAAAAAGTMWATFLGTDLERAYASGLVDTEDLDLLKVGGAAAGQTALNALSYLVVGGYAGTQGLRSLMRGTGGLSKSAASVAGDISSSAISKEARNVAIGSFGRMLDKLDGITPVKKILALVMEEEVAEIGQQMLERASSNLEILNQEALDEYVETAIMVLFPSLGMGGLGTLGIKWNENKQRRVEEGFQKTGNLRSNLIETLSSMYGKEKADILEGQAKSVSSEQKNQLKEILKEQEITVEDIHKIAEDRNIAWDNDPAFMAATKRLIGKYHLDESVDQENLFKMYAYIHGMPRQDSLTHLLTASDSEVGEVYDKIRSDRKSRNSKFEITQASVKRKLGLGIDFSDKISNEISNYYLNRMTILGLAKKSKIGKNKYKYISSIDPSLRKRTPEGYRIGLQKIRELDREPTLAEAREVGIHSKEALDKIVDAAKSRGELVFIDGSWVGRQSSPVYEVLVDGVAAPGLYTSRAAAASASQKMEGGVKNIVESDRPILSLGIEYKVSDNKQKAALVKNENNDVVKVFTGKNSESKARQYVTNRASSRSKSAPSLTTRDLVLSRFNQTPLTTDPVQRGLEQSRALQNLTVHPTRGFVVREQRTRGDGSISESVPINVYSDIDRANAAVEWGAAMRTGGSSLGGSLARTTEEKSVQQRQRDDTEKDSLVRAREVVDVQVQGRITKLQDTYRQKAREASRESGVPEQDILSILGISPSVPFVSSDVVRQIQSTNEANVDEVLAVLKNVLGGRIGKRVHLAFNEAFESDSADARYNSASSLIEIAMDPAFSKKSLRERVKYALPFLTHETVHHLRRMGVISPSEWSTLTSWVGDNYISPKRLEKLNKSLKARNRPLFNPDSITYLDYANMLYADEGRHVAERKKLETRKKNNQITQEEYDKSISRLDKQSWIADDYIEEAVAFAWQDNQEARLSGDKGSVADPKKQSPGNILTRFIELMRRFSNALRGKGWNSADEVFELMYGPTFSQRLEAGKVLDPWYLKRMESREFADLENWTRRRGLLGSTKSVADTKTDTEDKLMEEVVGAFGETTPSRAALREGVDPEDLIMERLRELKFNGETTFDGKTFRMFGKKEVELFAGAADPQIMSATDARNMIRKLSGRVDDDARYVTAPTNTIDAAIRRRSFDRMSNGEIELPNGAEPTIENINKLQASARVGILEREALKAKFEAVPDDASVSEVRALLPVDARETTKREVIRDENRLIADSKQYIDDLELLKSTLPPPAATTTPSRAALREGAVPDGFDISIPNLELIESRFGTDSANAYLRPYDVFGARNLRDLPASEASAPELLAKLKRTRSEIETWERELAYADEVVGKKVVDIEEGAAFASGDLRSMLESAKAEEVLILDELWSRPAPTPPAATTTPSRAALSGYEIDGGEINIPDNVDFDWGVDALNKIVAGEKHPHASMHLASEDPEFRTYRAKNRIVRHGYSWQHNAWEHLAVKLRDEIRRHAPRRPEDLEAKISFLQGLEYDVRKKPISKMPPQSEPFGATPRAAEGTGRAAEVDETVDEVSRPIYRNSLNSLPDDMSERQAGVIEYFHLGVNPVPNPPTTLWRQISKAFPKIDAEWLTRLNIAALNRFGQLSRKDRLIKSKYGVELLADASMMGSALMVDRASGFFAGWLKYGSPVYVDTGGQTLGNGNVSSGFTEIQNNPLTNKADNVLVGWDGDPESGKLKEISVSFDLYEDKFGGFMGVLSPIAALSKMSTLWAYSRAKRAFRLKREGKIPVDYSWDKIREGLALAEQHPEVAIAHHNLQNLNDGLVLYLRQAGILTEEMALDWSGSSDFIPFFLEIGTEGKDSISRLFKHELGDNPSKMIVDSLLTGIPSHKIEGVADEGSLMEPVEALAKNAMALITGGLKNVASRRAIESSEILGDAVFLPDEGKKSASRRDPSAVKIYVDGVEKWYRITDPLMHETIVGSFEGSDPAASWMVQVLGKPARVLRDVVTRMPDFMVANLIRDSLQIWMMGVGGVEGPIPIASQLKLIRKNLTDYYNNRESSASYQRLERGAAVGGYDSVALSPDRLRRKLNELSDKGNEGPVRSTFFKLWDASQEVSSRFESASREFVYDETVDKVTAELIREGVDPKLAKIRAENQGNFRALEIMNFSRSGNSAGMKFVTSMVPFLNARMQGMARLGRAGIYGDGVTGRVSPEKARQVLLRRAIFLSTVSTLYAIKNYDDPDFEDQSSVYRDMNWLVRIGDEFYGIPIPFELGVLFKVIPEQITRLAMGESSAEVRKSLKRQFYETLNFNITPQFAKPIIETWANKNSFTKQAIVPPWMEGLDANLQVKDKTSEVSRLVGGLFGASPLYVDNIVRGYFGTMGVTALEIVDLYTSVPGVDKLGLVRSGLVTRPSRSWYDYPLVKRFVKNRLGSGERARLYETREEIEKTVRSVNNLYESGRDEEAMERESISPEHFYYRREINSIKKEDSKIRSYIEEVTRSDMSPEEKRKEIEELKEYRREIFEEVRNISRSIGIPFKLTDIFPWN